MAAVEQTIYEAAGGFDGMLALAQAWHERCLDDPVVAHAFSHGFHPQHSERLAAYWAEALGGPSAFSETVADETAVRRMHAGQGEHQEMDDRAIACFVDAVQHAGLPDVARLREALVDYFTYTTRALAAYPRSPEQVPSGLAVTRWTWDGPVES